MRVVFLDMDGVLNSAEYFGSNPDLDADTSTAPDPKDDYWWTRMINPTSVERLNAIVALGDAKVVISSSWRYHCTPEDMQRYLSSRGFTGEVIGRTPLSNEMPPGLANRGLRGLEIEVWLVKNKHLNVENFVILDDMGDGAFAHMAPYLVRTSWARGIQPEDVARTLAILTGDEQQEPQADA